ncbi:methyl-accepting chemotaxis protein [Clostridium thermarum]|uniref:methyl-accepting chemotaxis protein n=1 Tax=Clostridium thermarum TaxID=1716543 RepID=UPI001122F878|nr:methyl-accepting chemotaxis protein [Clostridium thermarum]
MLKKNLSINKFQKRVKPKLRLFSIKDLKIGLKLNLSFLILISISLIIVSLISYTQFSKIIIDQNKNNLVELMKQKGESINRSLQELDKDFKAVANNDSLGEKVAKYSSMERGKKVQTSDQIYKYLDDTFKTSMDIADMFIVSNSQDIFYYGGSGRDKDYDIFSDPYYVDFINSEKDSLKTIPYVSAHSLTNQMSPRIITAFYRMRISTSLKSIGNLVVNLKEDYLYNLIKDMKVDYNTKVIILDSDNNIVMDPSNRAENGNKYAIDISSYVADNENHWFNKEIDKEMNLVTYYKFTNTDWILVGLTPISNMTKTASSIRLLMLIIGLVSLALAFFLSTFITKDITKGIKELIARMDKVKTGVLAIDSLPNRKDEVGLLGDRFVDMLESFRESIKDINTLSGITSEAADEISVNATKNFEEFENLSIKIMEIHNKSKNQNNDVHKINQITTELSNKIEEILSYFNTIGSRINNTKALTGEGKDSVTDLKDKSYKVADIIDNIAAMSTELNSEFKEIGKITEAVKGVAKQTDLLALNAEIEAARLGEQGKGFGVIAKSVKQLAAETSNSTKYIESIINKLKDKIKELNEAINISEQFMKEQVHSVEDTTESFDAIAHTMEEMVRQILIVKDEIENINNTREDINKIMDILSSSSEDNVAVSKEIAVSAEEKENLNEELVELSKHLKELAVDVESKVQKFKL